MACEEMHQQRKEEAMTIRASWLLCGIVTFGAYGSWPS